MRLKPLLVLASSSPRRRRLLEQLGLRFVVRPSDTEEVVPEGVSPETVVQALAREKAEAVAPAYPDALTLGADTIVVLDGEVLGKPADAAEAHAMLRRLSGNTHTVYTGIALVHPASNRNVTAFEATRVTFAPLTDDEIAAYVATGSPLDKAGAYGIQDDHGALFIPRIEGDFFTVMGLPLHRLYRVLRTEFADLMEENPD
ncbi:MAG: Maf-like protein [Rhodothermaceae bacterium]|nr:MAG: Maf-like protein [Rhodothermaceae bacterium]